MFLNFFYLKDFFFFKDSKLIIGSPVSVFDNFESQCKTVKNFFLLLFFNFYKVVGIHDFSKFIFLLKFYVFFFFWKKSFFLFNYFFDFFRFFRFFSVKNLHFYFRFLFSRSIFFFRVSKFFLRIYQFLLLKSGKLLNFIKSNRPSSGKEGVLKGFFSRLGYLKSFEEDFFYDVGKVKDVFFLRNKNLKLLQNLDGFFKFFFIKDSFRLFSFKESLAFLIKVLLNRTLFSRSAFWFIWKSSQIFRYFFKSLKSLSFLSRIKFFLFLKGFFISLSSIERRDFFFLYYLWCVFIFKLRSLFLKFRQRLNCFLRSSFFFRKHSYFFDFNFYNRIFFDFDHNFLNGSLLFSMGRDYFFKKYFVYHLTFKFFKFFQKNKFFVPFGFVGYLCRAWKLFFSKKFRKDNELFKIDKLKKSVFKSLRQKRRERRMKFRSFWVRIFRGFLRRTPFFKKRILSRRSRVPSFMSKFFYKKIFFFKYKLFLFFKNDLKTRFKIFSNIYLLFMRHLFVF